MRCSKLYSKSFSTASCYVLLSLAISALFGLTVQGFGQTDSATKFSVEITEPPHVGIGGPDATEPIAGKVKGVDSASYKVCIYAFAGGTWWVQPTAADPLTDIDKNGKWRTITHLGSTYAALIVKPTYKAPATLNSVPKIGAEVLAVTITAGRR